MVIIVLNAEESENNMAKRKSLKKRCSAVQRSNRAHRVCLKKVVKENGVASK